MSLRAFCSGGILVSGRFDRRTGNGERELIAGFGGGKLDLESTRLDLESTKLDLESTGADERFVDAAQHVDGQVVLQLTLSPACTRDRAAWKKLEEHISKTISYFVSTAGGVRP